MERQRREKCKRRDRCDDFLTSGVSLHPRRIARAGFKLYQEERKTRKRARGQHITRINSPCLTWKAIRNTRAGTGAERHVNRGGEDREQGMREVERGDRNEEEGTRVRS